MRFAFTGENQLVWLALNFVELLNREFWEELVMQIIIELFLVVLRV